MSAMEFVLIAYAILIGMGVAEILRGFADLIRARSVKLHPLLLVFGSWVLLILIELFWAMWRIEERASWTFTEFLVWLLPAALLYVIARVSFPQNMDGADLSEYYSRISPALWLLTACLYVSFTLLPPILYGAVVPLLLSSQLASAILAVMAVKFRNPSFHYVLLASMMAQLLWRGFVVVVS